ncbi:MAG TPA: hypothetical protein VHK28_06140 [Candidatus Limnocylindria bacterium]|nr:hypothetical protein [Candidatus Limnocylindria bacterium]
MNRLRVPVAIGLLLVLAACDQAAETAGLRTPPPFPGSAAALEWSDAGAVPPGFGPDDRGYASPQALIDAIVAFAQEERGPGGGVEMEAHLLGSDGRGGAVGVIYVLGSFDDAVAGDEVQLSMLPGDDGQWRVAGARVRTHCRRGVSEGLCR